jgi:hypothetical protein
VHLLRGKRRVQGEVEAGGEPLGHGALLADDALG